MKLVRQRNYIITLVLVSFALFFSHLEVLFVNIMEARNFIAAREMVTYDNWLLTTMNLEPRYEKPPLPTWLSALSGLLFGFKNLLAMRAPAAFSGIFLVLMLYYLSKSLLNDKKQSFINALIVATSFYIIFISREGSWDVFTHAFMLGAIWFLFQLFENNEHKWRNSIMAAILIGLSFLSKGPIGMFSLLIPFLIAYAIIFKFKNFKPKLWPIIIGALVAVVISSWWPIYIYLADTNVVESIADKESDAWSNRHLRPWYHYWSFPIQTGIWAIPAIISLMYPYLKSRVENLKVYQFTLIWTLAGLVLLSLIPEKKERYLVPVLIPMAINIGFYIRYLIQQGINIKTKKELYPAYFGFGIIAFAGITFPFVGYFFLKERLIDDFLIWFLITALILFLCGIFMMQQLAKKNFGNVFKAIIVFQVSSIVFGFPLVKSFYNNENFKNSYELHALELEHQIKTYSFGFLSPEFIWEYDGIIKNIYQHKKIQIPKESAFGILVPKPEIENFLKFFKNDFEIIYSTQIDINNIVNKKKLHRSDRLTRDFYILKKYP